MTPGAHEPGGAPSPSQRLLICGTRTFAEEVADLARDVPGFQVVAFVENEERERCREQLDGLPILWIDEIEALADDHVAVCALGTTTRTRFTDQVARRGVPFATLIHPTAHVSARSSVGEGAIVGPGAIIGSHSAIGPHVLLNRAALVGHHSSVGSHSSLMPGANVAGNVRIGERVFVGMGALVLNNVDVGDGAVIGAGSVVTRDVAPATQVVGAPARVVRQGVPGR